MKKYLMLVLCLWFLLPVTYAQKYLKKIQEKGELKVGMTAKQPPFAMKDKKGNIIGYEAELVEMLAEGMGVTLRIVEIPFSGLLDALEKGEVDMVVSGMTMTTKRNMKAIFVGPYLISGKSILTRSSAFANADSPEDLRNKDVKITVLKGSTSETFVRKEVPDAKVLPGIDYDACIKMLQDKQAQLMVADYPICAYTAQLQSEKGLITIDKPLTIEPIGLALPVDAAHFKNLVENYFNRLSITGVLEELEDYWFNSGEWVNQLPEKRLIHMY